MYSVYIAWHISLQTLATAIGTLSKEHSFKTIASMKLSKSKYNKKTLSCSEVDATVIFAYEKLLEIQELQ